MSPSAPLPPSKLVPQPETPEETAAQLTGRFALLSDRLKGLGFANASRMKLYGEEFEIKSDPIVEAEGVVFFDAVERKSHQPRRVRIPLNIVNMAGAERKTA